MAVTETITVLFTDLVGSTELSYALSPDAADELLRAHFSVLRRAIAASGGVEVKGLGDGVMVVFRSTSAALSCAVAMQQAVHRDNVGARDLLTQANDTAVRHGYASIARRAGAALRDLH